MSNYKLGSLFDGSGGFPLAGSLCGIEPCWASEVEPYPIAVTRERFPQMKHLGDISKIHGGEVEPVDIITFGSPCQDLSVAGKRAGLKHEANGDDETTRSGLFMEAVRIIKEMREATNGRYPTFALWENVPGAFSSNSGEDFRIVCEELIKIVEPAASMPPVPKNGWPYADSYVGQGWSLSYRTFNAQYWGVPQRRRRIHLVVDFRGERAREVLFEREGVRGYFAQGRTPWQAAPADAQGCTGADDRAGEGDGTQGSLSGRECGMAGAGGTEGRERNSGGIERAGEGFDGYNGDLTGDVSATLGVNCGVSTGRNGVIERCGDRGLDAVKAYGIDHAITTGGNCTAQGPCVYEDIQATLKASGPHAVAYAVPYTLKIRSGCEGGGNMPMVMEPFCKSSRGKFKGDAETWVDGKVVNTLNTFDTGETRANELVVGAVPIHDQATRFSGKRGDKQDGKGNGLGVGEPDDPMNTLTGGDRHAVAYRQGGFADYIEGEVGTLRAAGGDLGGGSENLVVDPKPVRYIVRRLTPTECARLQSFADQHGHIEQKNTLAPEEYRFWLDVRNTYDRIQADAIIEAAKRVIEAEEAKNHPNPGAIKKQQEIIGRAELRKEKTYTEKQMLTWYNKLWTDSAEYKMWGNGIALPPALYCMQGIADALESEVEIEEWML